MEISIAIRLQLAEIIFMKGGDYKGMIDDIICIFGLPIEWCERCEEYVPYDGKGCPNCNNRKLTTIGLN